MIPVKRMKIRIIPTSERVIPKFLSFSNPGRIEAIVGHIRSLDGKTVEEQLGQAFAEFNSRHIDFEGVLLTHYRKIEQHLPDKSLSMPQKLLIGAYFTHEYAVEAAALFNPSIVPHPDQSNLQGGELRFILSLRATGEGHISSIEFKTGVIGADGAIYPDQSATKLSTGKKVEARQYSKDFVIGRAECGGAVEAMMQRALPEQFSIQEALAIISQIEADTNLNLQAAKEKISDVYSLNYELYFDNDIPISSRVIFPSSRSESNGMEDARFVRFQHEDKVMYLGTYTAYNGRMIRPQLIETEDFLHFRIRPFYGKAASDKGMALFPEKINGKYAMIGRQGGRCLSIMYSDSLHFWQEYKLLQAPQRAWELLQIGNCGSPLKTPHGWLLLTHAVGPMRKYVLSFTLLDLRDPEIVLATLDEPFLSPNEEEREGYVPHVLYSCGLIQHRENLIIPYAMSDHAVSFAVVELAAVIRGLGA